MSVRAAALWTMGSQYISFVVQFIVTVLISRFFLVPAEVGLFSIALALAMLVAIVQDFGLTRFISGQKELGEEQIRTCSSISFIFALVVAGTLALLAWPTAVFYSEPRLTGIVLIIAASYLCIPYSIVPTAILMREMDFRSIFWITITSAMVKGGVALILAWQGFSAESLAWALIAEAVVKSLLAQYFRRTPVPFPLAMKNMRPVLEFGSTSTALYVIGGIGVRTPDLIIGRFLSLTSVGLFSRAFGLAGMLRHLAIGAIGSVFYPAFAKIRDRGEKLDAPYLRVVSGYTAVVWPAMLMLALAAQPVVLILYGETWAGVAPLLFWLALAEMIFPSLPMHIDLPLLMNKHKRILQINTIDTLIGVGTLIVASMHSVEWAAISRFVYGCLWFALYFKFMHGMVKFGIRDLFTVYAKSGFATLMAIVPFLLCYEYWLSPQEIGLFQLALVTGSGVVLWLGSLFVIRHPASDEIIGMAHILIDNIFKRKGHAAS